MEGKLQGVSGEGGDAVGEAPTAACEAHALPQLLRRRQRWLAGGRHADGGTEGSSGCVGAGGACTPQWKAKPDNKVIELE